MRNRELVPTIRALRDSAERARRHEIQRALRRLAKGDDPQLVVEQLSHALAAKLLHAPTHALAHAREEERDTLAELLTRIYHIPRSE
jgi:glutamyl-tRNA reductase